MLLLVLWFLVFIAMPNNLKFVIIVVALVEFFFIFEDIHQLYFLFFLLCGG